MRQFIVTQCAIGIVQLNLANYGHSHPIVQFSYYNLIADCLPSFCKGECWDMVHITFMLNFFFEFTFTIMQGVTELHLHIEHIVSCSQSEFMYLVHICVYFTNVFMI